MNELLEKLRNNSTIDHTRVLTDTDIYEDGDFVPTDIPMLNVALSGDLNRGLYRGFTLIAGKSKTGKSWLSMMIIAAYLKKYTDGVLLFYDSEYGAPKTYFEGVGIDPARVLHVPVGDIENLKTDMINQLEMIDEKKDRVIILIDSFGNIASRKELDDARNAKDSADLTRARSVKGLFRMISYHINTRNIPMLGIAHTYDSMSMYSSQVVSGGTGPYYAASNIWMMGRRQDKDSKDKSIRGYDFVITIEKSRFVKEKSRINLYGSWENGLERYSGLLEPAREMGFVTVPSQGWYSRKGDDRKYRAKDLDGEFWDGILADEEFCEAIRRKYMIGN